MHARDGQPPLVSLRRIVPAVGLRLALSLPLLLTAASGATADGGDPTASLAEAIATLTAPELAGRGAGTAGEREAARWFADRLAALGLDPAAGDGASWLQEFPLPAALGGGASANVLGAVPGRGALAARWIVLGAHIDHLGLVDPTATGPVVPGDYYPGAGDNASGVAAVLAALAMLAAPHAGGADGEARPGETAGSGVAAPADAPGSRSLLVCGFGAEEVGLLGSRHLAANLPMPRDRVDAMVNLDAVGRLGPGPLYAAGLQTCAALPGLADRAAAGTVRLRAQDPLLLRSDHVSFLDRGIPAVLLFTGAYPEMNSPADSMTAVDLDGLQAVSRFTAQLVDALRAMPDPCAFVPPDPPTPVASGGNRATWFGSVPDFTGAGAAGYRIGGVAPEGPAARAGLREGDVLVAMAGEPVTDLATFTAALRRHDPGDVVEVVVVREGTERRFYVTLGDRSERR